MFLVTVLVAVTAVRKSDLESSLFQAGGVCQKYNCSLKRLDYQQEQGLVSSLPLGMNHVPIERGLTTSATAIFVPFTTQELFQTGEALYYGRNALSNNLLMASRKTLKNPNGMFLGTPGSGKSFAAKREIVNVFLITGDDIIISDPEAEYAQLVTRLGGQVINLSPASAHYINPLDINDGYSEDEDPLTLKSDFVLSLMELIIGGKDGLTPVEMTIIDRCVRLVYRGYMQDPRPETMPVLGDLHAILKSQDEPEARNLSTALEIYVSGSLSVFNHRTNVDVDSRLCCFEIKELGKSLKKLGMLILQDAVWGRVTKNRAAGRTTWFYSDEFHLLLKDPQTAAYCTEIWKRFRKWGGVPSAITQNVKDLLASREVENIFENSDFIYMLSQAQGDRQILARQLGISNHQLSYVTHTNPGEGLLFFGNTVIPFVDHFPKDTELYRIMTTRPDEN
jgi:type IV secretory pathway VirB4 component